MRKLAFLAVLAACKSEPAPPTEPQKPPARPALAPPENVKEQEPNDFQRAQPIPLRAVVDGSLSAPRDDDWFRVAPGVGKTAALRIELKLVRDAWLEIYDRDRNRVLRIHAGGEDPGVVPAVACVESCFVKVSGPPSRYALTVLGADPVPGQ